MAPVTDTLFSNADGFACSGEAPHSTDLVACRVNTRSFPASTSRSTAPEGEEEAEGPLRSETGTASYEAIDARLVYLRYASLFDKVRRDDLLDRAFRGK